MTADETKKLVQRGRRLSAVKHRRYLLSKIKEAAMEGRNRLILDGIYCSDKAFQYLERLGYQTTKREVTYQPVSNTNMVIFATISWE